MTKYSYHKKAFTLLELLVYILITSVVLILIFIIFYSIIFYTQVYLDHSLLRSEMFRVLQKFYVNSITASQINSSSTNHIQFKFSASDFEEFIASGTSLYLTASRTVSNLIMHKFTPDSLIVRNFYVTSNGPFYQVFIELSNKRGDQLINATSVLYPNAGLP